MDQVYTNYETKKLVEEMLDSPELYGNVQNELDEGIEFNAAMARQFFFEHPYCNRYHDNIDWEQVAIEMNNC